jgi:hypothetical protein
VYEVAGMKEKHNFDFYSSHRSLDEADAMMAKNGKGSTNDGDNSKWDFMASC